MDQLLEHLDRWKPFNALVVGDFMLDQQLYGDAERLSADAPVPILHVRRQSHNPGGAANVCLDLAALRGRVRACGVIGADAHGDLLRHALVERGIDASGLVVDPSRPTTVKQNLIGLAQARHPQKMFRVDFESREPLSSVASESLLARVADALDWADVICIEDYAKGVCTEHVCQGVIDLARKSGKPIFVDPARLDSYSRYRRATAITPNRTEAEVATNQRTHGEADVAHNASLARALIRDAELDAVVLTLDRHGALLLERGAEPVAIPTLARTVYDVTGAGDMFLAGLAAARANGCSWEDAVRLANAAAGLEVEIFGVEPIPLERVHHAVLEQTARTRGKLRTPEQAESKSAPAAPPVRRSSSPTAASTSSTPAMSTSSTRPPPMATSSSSVSTATTPSNASKARRVPSTARRIAPASSADSAASAPSSCSIRTRPSTSSAASSPTSSSKAPTTPRTRSSALPTSNPGAARSSSSISSRARARPA
jgi:D-beta-D-heptose 7-phosphate kinase/D-beta-D-heptose 1-phosphate adenosyltransferase